MKKNTNIYKNMKFNHEPYSTNEKFCVYTPLDDEYQQQQEEIQRRVPQPKDETPQRQVQVEIEDYEPPIPQKPQTPEPHHKVNFSERRQLAQTPKYQTSSQRNFRITQSQKEFTNQMKKQKELQKLREQLYFDDRTKTVPKSTIKNHIIEDIVKDGDLFIKNRELMDQIQKLKQLNLLKSHDIYHKKYRGNGKFPFVYNDFHTKSTNNGYSRNFGGVFYTR